MDVALKALMATMIVWLPAVVTFVTELIKRIPQVPTPEKSIRYWVLGVAVVVTVGWYYFTGDLNVDNMVALATHTVINYAAAIGIYETLKNLIAKI